MPVPDIADRRHHPAGYQAADAGVVSRHAPARPRQEGSVQHRVGSAARDLNQRCLAPSAQADAGDARARPSLPARRRWPAHRDRRPYIGGERSGEGSGRDVDTPPSSPQSRHPMTVNRCTPASRSCAGSVPAKPNAYAPGSQPEPPSSATAANGFAASPSKRHVTGSGRAAARHPAFRWANTSARQRQEQPRSHSPCGWRQTSAALPRRLRLAFNRRFVLKTIHERLSRSPRRQPRRCPTGSSNWLRLDGKRERDYRTF